MTYASHTRRPNPAALAGALGIPAAVGALLIVGLAVTVVIAPEPPRLKGVTFTPTPLPPPPPPQPDQPKPANTNPPPTSTAATLPPRATMLPVDLGTSDPVTALPGTGELIGTGTGTGTGLGNLGIPGPAPSAAAFDPVGARPRGNPGRWVTDNDYRPRWIKEGFTGSARFALVIEASGKVTGCTVTRSTGHAALDAATCQLVTKRARFEPARDTAGKPVAGSYSGTINWKIPE